MKKARWLIEYAVVVMVIMLTIIMGVVYYDPFFHYHEPHEQFFYHLRNQRNQNNGIVKHFDYNAIITGTSMTENFKATEVDEIFGVKSIKVSYSGGTYNEINNNLKVAFENNDDIKIIIRGLDTGKFFDSKDNEREDLGEYPRYLYDSNPFNDVKYIFNRDIIFDWCLPAYREFLAGIPGGITDFDIYSNWMSGSAFGTGSVLADGKKFVEPNQIKEFSEEDKAIVEENINQNVISLAQSHQETIFYYFFTPYSIVWYGDLYQQGELERQLAAEQYAIERILTCENIKLFSFNAEYDIILNLDNYKDSTHYGEWINSLLLKYMYSDYGLLTYDNYEEYLEKERELFYNFDYNSFLVKNN